MKSLYQRVCFYIREFKHLIPIIIGYILSCFSSNKNTWIFIERGYEAQDNAWILYKYVKHNYQQLKSYFALSPKSNVFNVISREESYSILRYGSIKYYYELFLSKYIISTHVATFIPSLWLAGKLVGTRLYPKVKFVFLQHGITHNDIKGLHYKNLSHPINLFICGAKKEYDFVIKNFGYPNGVIKYTGFARFDRLHNIEVKKQVLIMPTWRMNYKNLNNEEFIKTDYFENYSKLLTNKELLDALREYGYKILFYNHYEFQKFNSLFYEYENEFIQIGKIGEITVQDLLKMSSVLVTDYSSVYYDFIYMKKPVLFFLFNQEEFYDQQYGSDLDNPLEYGDVVRDSGQLVKKIILCMESECKMDDVYLRNTRQLFQLYDNNNCKRIYESIISL